MLANGWPAHCARIKDGISAERCSSLQGHPSHGRVGIMVEFEFPEAPTADVVVAYLGVRGQAAYRDSSLPLPGLYATVMRANEFRAEGERTAWIGKPLWAMPLAGRHVFQVGPGLVEFSLPASIRPDHGCQTVHRVGIDVPSAITSIVDQEDSSVQLVIEPFLQLVDAYESADRDFAAPTLSMQRLVGRAAILIGSGLSQADSGTVSTVLLQASGHSYLASDYGRYISIPADAVREQADAMLCVGGLHCVRASIVPLGGAARGVYALVGDYDYIRVDSGQPHLGALPILDSAQINIPSLGIATTSYHILRPDGVACRSTSFCDYNEACPYKITTQCDIPASKDGCASGPAGAQAWGLALVVGAWAWRRRRRRLAVDG